MALTDADDVIDRMGYLLGTVWSDLSSDAQEEVVSQSMLELAWSFPITDDKQSYWVFERTKRHAVYMTLVTQAERFQYKQIKLQQKFDHYFKLVEKADKDFAKAIDEDPVFLLSDVNMLSDAFLYNPAGFVYDRLGKDLTYDYI